MAKRIRRYRKGDVVQFNVVDLNSYQKEDWMPSTGRLQGTVYKDQETDLVYVKISPEQPEGCATPNIRKYRGYGERSSKFLNKQLTLMGVRDIDSIMEMLDEIGERL